MNTSIKILCAVALLFCNCLSSVNCEPKGKTWVVCVAGYNYYRITYGFESGIYRLCGQIGGPGFEHKIIISPDSIAYHQQNVVAGHVIHDQEDPDQFPNYYEDMEITHFASNMSQQTFFNILSGKGRGKVVQSGPEDTLILAFITLGDEGFITLNSHEYIEAEQLVPFLESLSQRGKFKKCLLYLDSPASGSMFDGYLDTDKNIIAWTSGAKQDYFELCGKNWDVMAYTSTCHTLFFLNTLDWISENGYYNDMTLSDFYQFTRLKLSPWMPSIPMLFGQLDLANIPMKEFFGELVSKKPHTANVQAGQENKKNEKESNTAPQFLQIKGLNDFKALISDEVKSHHTQPQAKLEF